MFELPPEPTPLSILLAEKYPAAEIPAEKYPDKRAKKKRKRNGTKHLTEDELARLFSVIQSVRDRALFQLAYRAGLRASEIGLLQMRDYDAKADKIFVHRLKGSNSGHHHLMREEARALRA